MPQPQLATTRCDLHYLPPGRLPCIYFRCGWLYLMNPLFLRCLYHISAYMITVGPTQPKTCKVTGSKRAPGSGWRSFNGLPLFGVLDSLWLGERAHKFPIGCVFV